MIKPVHGLVVVALIAMAGCQESSTSGTSTSGTTTTTTTTTTPPSTATTTPTTTTTTPMTSATGDASGVKEVSMPDGLKYQDLTVGNGTLAESGSTVSVHYTGWLTNGTKFDSSVDRGQPFSFKIDGHQVIAGWDEGVKGMRVGGKRKLTIPPALGYGEQGAGGVIPPNATLVFDVELLNVQP